MLESFRKEGCVLYDYNASKLLNVTYSAKFEVDMMVVKEVLEDGNVCFSMPSKVSSGDVSS